MSGMTVVQDGKIMETNSQNSLKNANKTANSAMDKDAFLQLLVAQMRYQDPLQPTTNTEYVAQYAQFSQVEQMQNMSASMELQRASSLVGEEVYIKTINSAGETKYVRGKVDYVVYENNKAYLSIDEELYSLEDLDTIADSEYLQAVDKAEQFANDLRDLPLVAGVSLANEKAINDLETRYSEMNDYEKTFISPDMVDALNKYVERLRELKAEVENEESGS